MTRSTLPPVPEVPEVPEATVSELHALYREAAKAEPSPSLDRRILDAARAELKADHATKSRRPVPWWKGWLPAASALAIALVGLSVTWRVMDQQERDLRQEMKAADSVRERSVAAAGSAEPVQGAAEASPSPRAPAPAAEKDRRAESTAARDAPPAATAPAAVPAAATPMAPMAPMAPVVADEVLKKSGRAGNEELRERRDASAAMDAASGPARQAGKLEAGGPAIGSSGASGATAAGSLAAPAVHPAANSAAKSAAAPKVDGASPEAWLKQIRELRAAGRSTEAAESLARFRARYPDFVLPDDLRNLK